jgi:Protein of unknown function (DUF2442)
MVQCKSVGGSGVRSWGGRAGGGSLFRLCKSKLSVGLSHRSMPGMSSTATRVLVSDDTLTVELTDGRTISAPLAWFPRLAHGTMAERNNWKLIGKGHGIHWPDLDEDISVENLLAGKPSGESQSSLKRWLESRVGS